MAKDDKYALEMASPLNNLVARVGGNGKPAIVMPQQMAFPIKTVWRLPVPLLRRLFGRTQIYRVITQVVVYPQGDNGDVDIDKAVVTMSIRRSKRPMGLKGAMKDDWNEAWDAIDIMEKINPKSMQVRGSRDQPPYEKEK